MALCPGPVSLAYRGIFFLDKVPEFKREMLEAMRQPFEEGRVTIARAAATFSDPVRSGMNLPRPKRYPIPPPGASPHLVAVAMGSVDPHPEEQSTPRPFSR